MSDFKITDKLHRRHTRLFAFLWHVAAPFFKKKFNYTYDDLSGIEGPFLLLSNHNTNYDPIFVGMAAKNQIYFVASEHVLRNKFTGGFLNFVFAPIIHLKGKAGVNTISNMLRSLKAGYNVAIFPEGNRSFNGVTCEFSDTIGKLARKSGAKLVTFRMEGGYLIQPRWGFTVRKGKLTGKLVNIYSVEQLRAMTEAEVNEAIAKDLYEDAVETSKRQKIPYKGKKLAYGLESTVFACPKCKKLGRLHSTDTHLICECEYSAEYTEYGELIVNDGTRTTVAELDRLQKEILNDLVSSSVNTDEPLFTDEVVLMSIDRSHRISGAKTKKLSAYADRFELDSKVIHPSDILGLAIRSRNTLVTYDAETGSQYEIKGTDKCFCALKYLYLYNLIS